MSDRAPVPVSEASTTLLLKYSKTTLFLTVVLSTTSVTELKVRALAALADAAQPEDPELGRPFAAAAPEDVQVYVADTTDGDEVQYTPLENTATGKAPSAKDGSVRLDALALEDCQVLYLGFRRDGQGTFRG